MLSRTRHLMRKRIALIGALAAFMLSATLRAQPVPEHELKAAFVYNFILFTDWPPDAVFEGGILTICVNQNSTLRPPLQRLAGKAVGSRKIAVRALGSSDVPRACHVLFLGAGDRDFWKKIRQDMATIPVLTITDDDDIGRDGSILTMTMSQARIVFDVDTRVAAKARIAVSSKLMRLARNVL
jgi:hypothetical protein